MDMNDEVRQAVAKEVGQAVASKVATGVALFIGFIIFVAIGGVVVQLLWNWLLPPLFGVREVTLLQALGLLALSRILFGGFGHSGGSRGGSHRVRREWWRKGEVQRAMSRCAENEKEPQL